MTRPALMARRAGVNRGAEGSIDTTEIKEPIVGFVLGQKGLTAGASIEGSKFTKLKKWNSVPVRIKKYCHR